MTTFTSMNTNPTRTTRTLTFLLSLLAGMTGGTLLLVALWFLWHETTWLAQIINWLGITSQTPWHFTRSAGTVAYILLTGSTLWGLLLSSKIVKETIPAPLALAMHNTLSWLAISLTGFHALALLLDSYYSYTLFDLTIPFLGPYQPGWVGAGIIGLYLMLLTSVSFYWRKEIGQDRWRQLHYLTFVAYLLATLHGVMAGTDSGNPGMRVLYWGSGLLVLFLTNFRLLTVRSK